MGSSGHSRPARAPSGPGHPTDGPEVSEIRATVSLAAQGMSDREIARVLNCSVRTVTRRFSGAMRHYGARSRFHLGFVVASLGEPAD